MSGVVGFFSAENIPGDNSFIPLRNSFLSESEVIFLELDSEVLFYGQPCGMIVATTLALANSAVNLVEIVYERTQEQQENRRPIIPSISHWRAIGDSQSACEMTSEHFRFFPNCEAKLSNSKQIKGIKLFCNIFQKRNFK